VCGTKLRELAILIAAIVIMAIALPNVLLLAHVMHKWQSIPICKPLANGTKIATHHETEGNVSTHINKCA
jgi:hypothetical protein